MPSKTAHDQTEVTVICDARLTRLIDINIHKLSEIEY